MLAVMSSKELSEWQAFEEFEGPIGQKHDSEILLQIHELLQLQLSVSTGSGGEGWRVERPRRPWWTPPDPEEDETEEEYLARIQAELEHARAVYGKG